MKTTLKLDIYSKFILTIIAIFLIGIFLNTCQTEIVEAQNGYVYIGNPEDIANAISKTEMSVIILNPDDIAWAIDRIEPDIRVVNTVDVNID